MVIIQKHLDVFGNSIETLSDAGAVDNIPGNSTLFKFKQKITGATGNDGTKNVEIMVP